MILDSNCLILLQNLSAQIYRKILATREEFFSKVYNISMNQICIAKKVSQNNVEFLDFALDDNDQLITFGTFKEASEFLKKEVGTGEQLLDFIITTVEAQKNNPRMTEILSRTPAQEQAAPQKEQVVETPQTTPPVVEEGPDTGSSDVECYFVLDCSNFSIVNNDSIVDKVSGKQLIPVLAFVDAAAPDQLVQVPHFKLKHGFIGEVKE